MPSARVGYRTTAEITALANRVRRTAAPAVGAPATGPSTATGPRPCSPPCPARQSCPRPCPAPWPSCGARGAPAWGSSPAPPARALALAPPGPGRAPDAQLALAPDFAYRGGVIVLPVALAKGLEFDAAVVVDADGATYGPSAFDARLLYVALTRALHALRVI